ncbi:MAG: hypothetical protein H6619_07045 [Deltaproteobacteria bacterium]|nr:hypothetical protein [Deltaproteobacteria bacterium]
MPSLRVKVSAIGETPEITEGLGQHWCPGGEDTRPHIAFAGFQLDVLSFGGIPDGQEPTTWFPTDGFDCFVEGSSFGEIVLIETGNDEQDGYFMLLITMPEGVEFDPREAQELSEAASSADIYFAQQGRQLLALLDTEPLKIICGQKTLVCKPDDSGPHGVSFTWVDTAAEDEEEFEQDDDGDGEPNANDDDDDEMDDGEDDVEL